MTRRSQWNVKPLIIDETEGIIEANGMISIDDKYWY